jgi:hypothetical protein
MRGYGRRYPPMSREIVDVVFFLAPTWVDEAAGLQRELESSGWGVRISYPEANEQGGAICVCGSRDIDELGGTMFGIDDDAMDAMAERFNAKYDGSGLYFGSEPESRT